MAGLTGVKHASVGASLGPSLMIGPIGERGQEGILEFACRPEDGKRLSGTQGQNGEGVKTGAATEPSCLLLQILSKLYNLGLEFHTVKWQQHLTIASRGPRESVCGKYLDTFLLPC